MVTPPDATATESGEEELPSSTSIASYTASLVPQGKHRFYTLSMPSDVLAATCVVDTRSENPIDGFQRVLDEKRAQDIADYIDSGLGTIPTSIVLSAQKEARLEYTRKTRTLKFHKTPRSFLIIDGQHRVYGFHLAKTKLRVPVVIYNELTRAEESRLFIDINTKQRPVPNELLLDIKRLAESETDTEALLRDIFDLFNSDPTSPLLGMLSSAERRKGKISRVTFNNALKPIWNVIGESDAEYAYEVLGNYLHACLSGLRSHKASDNITNPTLFRALILLFPIVAERVADRHSEEYSATNFNEILSPFFQRLKRSDLKDPGSSPKALADIFKKALRTGFSISGAR